MPRNSDHLVVVPIVGESAQVISVEERPDGGPVSAPEVFAAVKRIAEVDEELQFLSTWDERELDLLNAVQSGLKCVFAGDLFFEVRSSLNLDTSHLLVIELVLVHKEGKVETSRSVSLEAVPFFLTVKVGLDSEADFLTEAVLEVVLWEDATKLAFSSGKVV